MNNLITTANLLQGVAWLRKKKCHWGDDFHSMFYKERLDSMRNGFNEAWWESTLSELGRWKALRGAKEITKEKIRARGLQQLTKLQSAYNQIVSASDAQQLSLLTVSWPQVNMLYGVAHEIKNVPSPVFASKLCHFILPDVYPVVDEEVIGLSSYPYKQYWRFCRIQWRQCQDRESIQNELRQVIGPQIYSEYPFSTKITELCFIGIRKIRLKDECYTWLNE